MKKMYSLNSHSEEITQQFARHVAQYIKAGDIICLFGDLGTGKTTLVKGLAVGLNIASEKVNSPTFVLMNIYKGRKKRSRTSMPMYHFDLYRLENMSDISLIGYEEYFYGDGLAVIEWADRLEKLMPKEYLGVYLKHNGECERKIICKAYGLRYNELLNKIKDFKV